MDFLSWIAATLDHWQAHISTSDLAYVTAVGAAATAALAFFKRVRTVAYEFLVSPVKDFFSKFNSLNKRVAHMEKTLYNKTTVEKLENMEKMLISIEDNIQQIQANSTVFRKQIKKLEALQKSILNISEIPTFETDSRGACTFANKASLDLLGRTFEELKNFGWLNIIHPEDRQKVKDEWDAAIRDRRNFELTFRIVCKEHIVYRVFCESHPIHGDSEGYIGHYQNIEEIGKI